VNAGILRVALTLLLEGLLAVLPHEVQESILSRATLAIINAESEVQAQLEVTAVMAEIKAELAKLGGNHA
jgi:hypothetical protein